MSPPSTAVGADVRRFVSLLWLPGDVREVRIPRHNKYGHTASGYFDDPEKLADAVMRWDGRANIYLTLNPVNPSLLARAHNRILDRAETTTADGDVLARHWLPVDVDAERATGISSTSEELAKARTVLGAVVRFLRGHSWPEPIIAMSGNGYYALYRIDLLNDPRSLSSVKAVLTVLAKTANTESAHVDSSVFNASRIIGLVGTLKVKGDPLPDRPHRRSRLEVDDG